ncbi:MAG: hypothetical protein ACUVQI_03680 [Thermochromatium sp.]
MPIKLERSIAQGFPLVILTSVLFLLTGCPFNPLKPKSDAPAMSAEPGNACVAHCDLAKAHCEGRQRLREQLCQEQAERLKNETTPCNTVTPRCPPPMICLGEDLGLCRTQHAECLSRCAAIPPEPAAADRAES